MNWPTGLEDFILNERPYTLLEIVNYGPNSSQLVLMHVLHPNYSMEQVKICFTTCREQNCMID